MKRACAICRAVSLTLVPRSLLLNRTETLATQAILDFENMLLVILLTFRVFVQNKC